MALLQHRPSGLLLPLVLLLLLHHPPALASPHEGHPDRVHFNITVPKDAEANEEDAYVCTTLALPAQAMKLVAVEPLARQEVVHHILLFGCSVPHVRPNPGNPQPVWDCKMAPTCGSYEETILYGWGRNAPKLELPKGVGFSVGGGSSIRYIVAQVHYLQPKPKGDTSGVILTLQKEPVPFAAGLLSYASWFTIPPGQKQHLVKNSCCYKGFQPLQTFAVRVHTHTLGRSVFMTRRHALNATASDVIASGDPLKPQGFNPVQRRTIFPGDPLMVTCAFDSTGVDHPVMAGPTHDKEMCNMYLMVYSTIPHIEMCSDGEGVVALTQPGNLPPAAAARLDPHPLWRPPKPSDASGQGVLGDVTSVAMGPDGRLWALHRGGAVWDENTFGSDNKMRKAVPIAADVVVVMEPNTGKVLHRWGSGHFYMPHMITVDHRGHVWVTDVGRHQVLKFTPDGRLLMEVGEKLVPGRDGAHLCKPTQVAFLRDGSFVVSDGYCNARAALFNAAGKYVSEFSLPAAKRAAVAAAAAAGGAAVLPAGSEAEVVVAHSVAVEECGRRLYLADREGKRVLTFDLDTHQLTQVADLSRWGRVWALQPGPYGRLLALAWERGADASLVEVSHPFDPNGALAYALPGSADKWPHDLALGAAPLALSGAGDRLFAVNIAPLCVGCGPVLKYVLFPDKEAAAAAVSAAEAAGATVTGSGKPVLAHLGSLGVGHGGGAKAGGGAAAAGAGGAAAAAKEAAEGPPDAEGEGDEAAAAAEEETPAEAEAESSGGKGEGAVDAKQQPSQQQQQAAGAAAAAAGGQAAEGEESQEKKEEELKAEEKALDQEEEKWKEAEKEAEKEGPALGEGAKEAGAVETKAAAQKDASSGGGSKEAAAAAPAAAGGSGAAEEGPGDEEEEEGSDLEDDAPLAPRQTPPRAAKRTPAAAAAGGGWGSAVAVAGAVLVAAAAGVGYKLYGPKAAGAAGARRPRDGGAGARELVKLTNGHRPRGAGTNGHANGGGGGAANGGGGGAAAARHVHVIGEGNGGGGADGWGDFDDDEEGGFGDLAEGDEDLERLEREMLLHRGPGSAAASANGSGGGGGGGGGGGPAALPPKAGPRD